MDWKRVTDFFLLLPPAGHGSKTVNQLTAAWNAGNATDPRDPHTIALWANQMVGWGLAERFTTKPPFTYRRAATSYVVLATFMDPQAALRVLMAQHLLQVGLPEGEIHPLIAIAKAVQGAPRAANLQEVVRHLPPPEDQLTIHRHWVTLCDACSRGRTVRVTGFAAGQVAIVSIFGLVTQGVHRYLIGGQNLGEVGVVRLDQVENIEQELGHASGPPDGFNLEQLTAGDWLEGVPSLFGNAGGQQ
jgi:hypothetical protein